MPYFTAVPTFADLASEIPANMANDDDYCLVGRTDAGISFHQMDIDSAATEDLVTVITPDLDQVDGSAYTGDKRWLLTSVLSSGLEARGFAGAGGILTLSTAELTVVDGNKLGQIDFQAPVESSGTDAILVGASIWAEADDTFAADNNTTDLVFATAASETATEKMRLDSAGLLSLQGNLSLASGDITGVDSITATTVNVTNLVTKINTWTTRSSVANNPWYNVAYGNGLFVAVATSGTNQIMTSPDGINWTARTNPNSNWWRGICYGNGLFVSCSYTGTGDRIMTSPDGITWESRISAADNDWLDICYGNGIFVAIANTGTGDRVMTSYNGIDWNTRSSAADNSWRSVCYGNGLFVAVASSGSSNRVMTSPDGITWTIRTSAADSFWNSVCYGNGLFVAVAYSGTDKIMTSPDGVTWTVRTAAASNQWTGVCYGEGYFVAVSDSGSSNRVMTSPDGITWESRISAADNSWYGIGYGNGVFVAVSASGSGNRVMTAGFIEKNDLKHDNIYHGYINLADETKLILGDDGDGEIFEDGGDIFIENTTSDKDIVFLVNDGGSADTEIFRVDGSASSILVNSKNITGVNSITATTFTDGTATYTSGNITGAGSITASTLTDSTLTINAGNIASVESMTLADDKKIKFGTGNDGEIFVNSDDLYIENVTSNKDIIFLVNDGGAADTEVIRIAGSTSKVGFGIAAPDGKLHVHTATAGTVTANSAADDVVIENSADGGLSILTPDANNANLYLGSPSDNYGALFRWNHDANLMTITTAKSGASVLFGCDNASSAIKINSDKTVGIYSSSPQARLDVDNDGDTLSLRVDRAGSTGTNSIATFVSDSGGANTTVCKVMVDGDLENVNNSYGAISDEKLKENIVDATSKLEDIMNLKIRNFNFKNKPSFKQIGVVAQEIEQIFPGLIKEKDNIKSVKYSVLLPILIKAFQELVDMVYHKEKDFEKRLAALEK